MTPDSDGWTSAEAYEHMTWCEGTANLLRELTEEDARAWWDNDCEHPDWLGIAPEAEESLLSFAERLDCFAVDWAELGVSLDAAEKAATEEKERKKAIRTLEGSINRTRDRLELVRLCQKTPEPDRRDRYSGLADECGYLYLMKKLVPVRTATGVTFESRPTSPYKIGATLRPFKERRDELWREKHLTPVCRYATVAPFELETALQQHFDEFRKKRGEDRQKGERTNKPGEFFALPEGEVSTFIATVAKVEKWVLLQVEAEMELELLRIGALLQRIQTSTA